MIFRTCLAALLLAVFCVQAQQLTQSAFRRMLMDAARKCAKENNITAGLSMDLFNQSGTADRKMKCFANCFLDQFSLLDGNGNFKSPAMQSFVNNMPKSQTRETIERNFKNCVNSGITDPCEKSYRLMSCLFRTQSNGRSGQRLGGSQNSRTTQGR